MTKPFNKDLHDFTPIQSSNLRGAFHDGNDLYIEFVKGPIYVYRDVPEETFNGLLEAGSAGRYFQAHILNIYETAKVSG